MKKWIETTLQNACVETSQRDPRNTPKEYFTYVDIASINRERKLVEGYNTIIGSEAPSRARKEIKVNDVIVSTVRPNLNAVAIISEELNGQIASTGFCILRPNQEKLLPRYLLYFACTNYFIDYLVSRTSGASYPSVTDAVVKSTPIYLPPLSEQDRIVRLLDEAESLRAMRFRANARTKQFVLALFQEMFGDPIENNKKWKLVALQDITFDWRGGSPLKPTDFFDTGFPVLHKGALKPYGQIETDVKKKVFTHSKFIDKYHRSVVNKKHIVATLRDLVPSGPSIGLMSKLSDCPYPEYILAQGVYAFLIDENRVTPDYLVYLSNIPSFRTYLKKFVVGSTQIHIRTPLFMKLTFPLPSLDLQREFAARVEAARGVQSAQGKSTERLEALYQSMLSRAFAGEL